MTLVLNILAAWCLLAFALAGTAAVISYGYDLVRRFR